MKNNFSKFSTQHGDKKIFLICQAGLPSKYTASLPYSLDLLRYTIPPPNTKPTPTPIAIPIAILIIATPNAIPTPIPMAIAAPN
jgi:hypothetical protein